MTPDAARSRTYDETSSPSACRSSTSSSETTAADHPGEATGHPGRKRNAREQRPPIGRAATSST